MTEKEMTDREKFQEALKELKRRERISYEKMLERRRKEGPNAGFWEAVKQYNGSMVHSRRRW
ncbi:hypothetical protein NFX39_03615 [Fructobacillus sp. W13]|uniref:Uncharacterized protein n=1 Tax=Fructobacillus apis TaxID=2935017 RepID=A0ABT0ZQA6_9LACO|nr:hypothetical protein [Fructobacillus apis]MCO0832176.1 hypothetical protein [Fructobacillus apis]